MRAFGLIGTFLFLLGSVAAQAATAPQGGPKPVSAALQRAANQCFGKEHVDWPGLAQACGEVIKAKVKPSVKAGAYFNRGSAYLRLGGGKNALDDFNAALKIMPDFGRALEARGGILIGQGKADAGIADLTKAISLNAKSSAAYNNRGMGYLAKKDYPRAIADFTKSIELEPSDAKGYSARGEAYLASGDSDRALGDFNKALQLDGKLTIALLNRGSLYAKKGEMEKARADFNAVLAIYPDNQQAKDELKALGKSGA